MLDRSLKPFLMLNLRTVKLENLSCQNDFLTFPLVISIEMGSECTPKYSEAIYLTSEQNPPPYGYWYKKIQSWQGIEVCLHGRIVTVLANF